MFTPAPADEQAPPATPGDWTWSLEAPDSVARFGEGLFVLRCDRQQGRIELRRSGGAQVGVPLTVTTTTLSRALAGETGGGAITASLVPGDPLLDAMAYSRGRFQLAATGLPTLAVPSWPELSRVVEDCR